MQLETRQGPLMGSGGLHYMHTLVYDTFVIIKVSHLWMLTAVKGSQQLRAFRRKWGNIKKKQRKRSQLKPNRRRDGKLNKAWNWGSVKSVRVCEGTLFICSTTPSTNIPVQPQSIWPIISLRTIVSVCHLCLSVCVSLSLFWCASVNMQLWVHRHEYMIIILWVHVCNEHMCVCLWHCINPWTFLYSRLTRDAKKTSSQYGYGSSLTLSLSVGEILRQLFWCFWLRWKDLMRFMAPGTVTLNMKDMSPLGGSVNYNMFLPEINHKRK